MKNDNITERNKQTVDFEHIFTIETVLCCYLLSKRKHIQLEINMYKYIHIIHTHIYM